MPEPGREQLEQEFEQSCLEMERLMERMPQIQTLNDLWKKSRNAQELLAASKTYRRLVKELAFLHEEERRYARSGNAGMSAYVQSQMGYRQGPLNEAREKWLRLKEESGWESEGLAEQWLDSCGDVKELERQIRDYQSEYDRALQLCQRLDQKLSALEEDVP